MAKNFAASVVDDGTFSSSTYSNIGLSLIGPVSFMMKLLLTPVVLVAAALIFIMNPDLIIPSVSSYLFRTDPIFKKIDDWYNKQKKAIGEKLIKIKGRFAKKVSKLNKMFKKTKVGKFIRSMKKWWTQYKRRLGTMGKNFAQDMRDIKAAIKAKLTMKRFGSSIKKWWKSYKFELAKIKNNFTIDMRNIKTAIGKSFRNVTKFAKPAKQWWRAYKKEWGKMGKNFTKDMGKLKKVTNAKFTKFMTKAQPFMKWGGRLLLVYDFVTSTRKDVKEGRDVETAVVVNLAGVAAGAIVGAKIGTIVGGILGGPLGALIGFIGGLIVGGIVYILVQGVVKNIGYKMADAYKPMKDHLLEDKESGGFSGHLAGLSYDTLTLIEKLYSGIKSFTKNLLNIGKNAPQKILSGYTSVEGLIMKKGDDRSINSINIFVSNKLNEYYSTRKNMMSEETQMNILGYSWNGKSFEVNNTSKGRKFFLMHSYMNKSGNTKILLNGESVYSSGNDDKIEPIDIPNPRAVLPNYLTNRNRSTHESWVSTIVYEKYKKIWKENEKTIAKIKEDIRKAQEKKKKPKTLSNAGFTEETVSSTGTTYMSEETFLDIAGDRTAGETLNELRDVYNI